MALYSLYSSFYTFGMQWSVISKLIEYGAVRKLCAITNLTQANGGKDETNRLCNCGMYFILGDGCGSGSMDILEIRKNAPYGATHYSDDFEVVYLMMCKGVWQCWVFDGWFLYQKEDDEEIKPL